ncbi:MAG: nucleotidyl transferase AbiEii/AbiGii toxin family protein [Candidatus Omnitrophica bacterium]|nr:nucleotidyl transferase AbiEii/AbiGii toxin family protein [Candidatus Omnitrophota bacterium]
MDNIAALSHDKRRELFQEASAKRGMSEAIMEKDFWVCWTLLHLFEHPELSSKILFKGGTSLSKAFHLIDRFSEDIDLVLDWTLLTDEDPNADRSRKQQKLFNEDLIQKSQTYIRDFVKGWVEDLTGELCKVSIDEEHGGVILIKYPEVFKDKYLRSEVRLEIGPRSDWIPHGEYKVVPYAAEVFPEQFKVSEAQVVAIKAERTFWEKATILHQEAFRPDDKMPPLRYSRHYYDLAFMSRSAIKENALKDVHLLGKVIEFNQRFFPSTWARYELARPGSMKLMPPHYVEKVLRDDYAAMEQMIFGEYPSFEDILKEIKNLEDQINGLHL